MSSIDLIRMGFKNLWRRKLRTLLTVLGVVIGTASIVLMISLGIGMNESFRREIERMGSLNVINVYPGYGDVSGGKGTPGMPTPLDDDIVVKIKQIEGVEAVTPVLDSYLKIVSGKYAAYVSILGIDPETMEAFDFEVKEGRLLDASDTTGLVFGSMVPGFFQNMRARNRYFYYGGFGMNQEEAPVDVLNDRLEMTFDFSYGEKRGPQDPGQGNKRPKVYKVKGVGILKDGSNEYDYSVIMNITELKKIIEENQRNQGGQRPSGNIYDQAQSGYQRILVKAKDISLVQEIQKQILELGVNAYSLTDILESVNKQSEGIRRVLGGIGAVSLLVAAIGITNTMVMSIYERTREIGVMKVIGAALSDIRRIFLFEAGMIGMMGGIFGLGLSYLASILLNKSGFSLFGGMMPAGPDSVISIIPPWLALFAVIFTALVGLVSGFYPARRAMKLSALEAIRTE